MKNLSMKPPKIMSSKPPIAYSRAVGSFYKNLFESMEVGQWFECDERTVVNIRSAAVKHARGRYSIRKHAKKANKYVYIKTK